MDQPLKPSLKSMETLSFLDNGESRTMYQQAELCKTARLLDGNNGTIETRLNGLATEIRLRVKITQQEIYYIGEMLVMAKEIIKKEKRNFKDWVTENFEFGYHTALNFCNVYTACMGHLPFIEHAKPSILYKISAKDFPKDLRDVLVINNILPKLTNSGLAEIYQRFNEEGFKAVEPLLEEKAQQSLIYSQSLPFLDKLSNLKYQLEKVIYDMDDKVYFEYGYIDDRKGATEAGDKINKLIIESFKKCAAILEETFHDANRCLNFTKKNIILAEKTKGDSVELLVDPTTGYKKIISYLDEEIT